ncbi:two-component system response regulator BaeR [Kushneria sinocarnis]|uniref:Two-component system response regulator BaeR n=1 Tax=Kushneria sinocarnis TaxID=595502 RepID=A0A420X017_9GAMM|nr:response regulator [Kushneria sinocarnis]RKR06795.1 two-component system response regulator BaeR [Kushneria sinocarnis]
MSDTVLIVEDEPRIAELIADYLQADAMASHWLDHGDRVMAWLAEHADATSLVLLDIMLPGRDGLALCRDIRARYPRLPIIMLTARVEEIDRLLGLELGADDYICKPFSPREVIARIRAVLRRMAPVENGGAVANAALAGLTLDQEGWRALADNRDLGLTAVEFQLLWVMTRSPGRIFSREQLMDRMYRDHRIVSERTVDSHIKKLRRKIADIWPERDIIHSVYGVGYKYEPRA